MAKDNTDSVLLRTLQKMTDRKKLAFTLGCLDRLALSALFNKSDAMLFADTIITMKSCLIGESDKSQLDEFIAFISPRCGELHHASSATLHLIADKYKLQARSYAADAIYATSELIYHYLSHKNCPINIMHALENIRLSQKWQTENNVGAINEECAWQIDYAKNVLSGKDKHRIASGEIIEFTEKR